MITKHKDFLICIDSDGCVFDNMELKHKECFCPATVNVWDLQAVSKYAREAAEFVNLYSETRGTNRFPALIRTLELLGERPEARARGYRTPDLSSLKRYVENAEQLSGDSLALELKKYPGDRILETALHWSNEVNENIARIVRGAAVFPAVEESLKKLGTFADILIVSATPHENIVNEWREAGILEYADAVAGQESGSKKDCIRKALIAGYSADRSVMIGDAPGDLAAAKGNGVLFYPVIPGREEQSWEQLAQEVAPQIRDGGYGPIEAQEYIARFQSALLSRPPWESA